MLMTKMVTYTIGERGETVVGSSGLLGVTMVFGLGGRCWLGLRHGDVCRRHEMGSRHEGCVGDMKEDGE